MKKLLLILGISGLYSTAFAEESYLCTPFSDANQPTLGDIGIHTDKIVIRATSDQTGTDFDLVIHTYCASGSATDIDTNGITSGPLTYDNIVNNVYCFYQLTEPILSQYVHAPTYFTSTSGCIKNCANRFPEMLAANSSIIRGLFHSVISW